MSCNRTRGAWFRFSRAGGLSLLLLVPSTGIAQGVTDGVLGAEHAKVVEMYVTGLIDPALAALGAFPEDRIRRDAKLLSAAAVRIRNCPNCNDGMIFGRFPIRAALLLHADRESRESLSRPESEQVPVCRIGIHSLMVEQFARILLLVDPKAEIFVRNVYLGLSRHAQWTHCAQIAERWAAMGLKLFPRDSQLHLALGIAREMVAFYTAAPAAEATELSPAVLTAGAINRQVELLSRYRGLWEVTRDAYKAALAADSTNVEANLRMGRVLSRLGKAEAAIPHLEAVLADGTEPRLMYLAHLFLGRLLEEKGLFAEAERQYLEALKRDPLSLTTLVALSHLRFVQGDQGAAREMLMAGLKRVRSRTTHDPWAAYQITQRPEGRELLDKLRKEILP